MPRPGNVAEDSDVYVVHEDFFGIPWDAFMAGEAPPEPWVDAIDVLASDAENSGAPVYLAVALVHGSGRTELANRTVVVDGELMPSEGGWSASCYDFATAADAMEIRAAYLDYLRWMIDRFEPTWLNVAIEVNHFQANCPTAWAGMVDMHNAAYREAKSIDEQLVVFSSMELTSLYGLDGSCADPDSCFADNLVAIEQLELDRIAVSTYPYGLEDVASVEDIPADWLTRMTDALGLPMVIAETGWNGSDIVGSLDGECVTYGEFSEADQVAYVQWLARQADALDMDFVTWWSNRDLIPSHISESCDCAASDQMWCEAVSVFNSAFGEFYGEVVFKFWGTMGLRTYDGSEKTDLMAVWDEVRSG